MKLAQKTARGRQMIADVDAYLRGINAYFKSKGGFVKPFARNDVIAFGTLIGAVFGAGAATKHGARSSCPRSSSGSAPPGASDEPAHLPAGRRVPLASLA